MKEVEVKTEVQYESEQGNIKARISIHTDNPFVTVKLGKHANSWFLPLENLDELIQFLKELKTELTNE